MGKELHARAVDIRYKFEFTGSCILKCLETRQFNLLIA